MYYKGKDKTEVREVPFQVICTNCGSHNVDVTAFEHYDLEMKCNSCGSYLEYGRYNETTYTEFDL